MIKTDPDWWKHLFDETYLITDARSVCNETITRREVDCFERILSLRPHDRILDLCGGEGRHSLELARRKYRNLVLLDYSSYLLNRGLKRSREEGLRVFFGRGDARAAGFKEKSFNAVMILANSFGYFQDDRDDELLLRETYRLLAEGGRVLLDISDISHVRSSFKSFSCHRATDECFVIRVREIKGNRISTSETVASLSKGIVRELSYSEKLYEADELEGVLRRVGFCNIEFHRGFSSHEKAGDYGFLSKRLLITGRK